MKLSCQGSMPKFVKARITATLLAAGLIGCACGTAAADTLRGQVIGGGQPISNSTVTLWAAGAGAPTQLGQARTGVDGSFTLSSTDAPKDTTLYLIAKGGQPKANAQSGDNPSIALLTVIGSTSLATVTINEMTTVASVWTHAQFLDGAAIKGPPLSLRIAAGNVPNFVDLQSGGWGATIQDPLNSGQTPTMANFATLADALAGCVTRVTADACPKLYTAATPPKGDAPNDTLTAAQSIARAPWYQPTRVFALSTSSMRFRKAKTFDQFRTCPISTLHLVRGFYRSSSMAEGIVLAAKPCSTVKEIFG